MATLAWAVVVGNRGAFSYVGMLRRLRYWLKACRLRTLSLSLSAVGLGSALAYQQAELRVDILVLLVLTATGLQLLSNLANDLGDSLHGIDHLGRVGPARMVQRGYLSAAELRGAILGVAVATFGCGLGLLWQAFGVGWLFGAFLGLGLLAIWAALRYAYGHKPYGHKGGGDLSVWIFFGLVGVKGSYLLHTQSWNSAVLLPVAAMGAYAVAVLNINNLRDIDSDLSAGKHTLAARLGRKGAIHYHRLLLLGAAICWLCYGYMYLPIGWQWLFVLVYPAWVILAASVHTDSTASTLNRRLQQTAFLSLVQVLVFVAGLWIDAQ